jgi:hypothetical protein
MSRVHHLLIDAEYTFVGVENEILREEDVYGLDTLAADDIDDIRDIGRFAVVYNAPGYLPECEPVYFDDEAEAEQYVRECRLSDEDNRTTGYVYDIVDMAQ